MIKYMHVHEVREVVAAEKGGGRALVLMVPPAELAEYHTVRCHPGDNIRANGTSQKWTRPGMPTDAGGILRGCPLLGSAICPNAVSRVMGH